MPHGSGTKRLVQSEIIYLFIYNRQDNLPLFAQSHWTETENQGKPGKRNVIVYLRLVRGLMGHVCIVDNGSKRNNAALMTIMMMRRCWCYYYHYNGVRVKIVLQYYSCCDWPFLYTQICRNDHYSSLFGSVMTSLLISGLTTKNYSLLPKTSGKETLLFSCPRPPLNVLKEVWLLRRYVEVAA